MSMTIPPEVVIWRFGGKTGNVKSQNTYTTNSGYNLYCSANQQYLSYGSEPVGINLAWNKTGDDKKIHFVLPDKREREVLTGEVVSFGVGGGDQFLYYTSRTFGINLSWSANPVFEWTICGADGIRGVPIVEGQMYAMVNSKVQPAPDFFIYLDRVPGQADVGWTTSPNWPAKVWANVDKYKGDAAFLASLL
jgi:hypothetical protein